MAKFPAMPLWTDPLLADTHHMTAAVFGRYMRLLIDAWLAETLVAPFEDLADLEISIESWDRHVEWATHPSQWPSGTWRDVRQYVLARDGEKCAYCGCEDGPFDIDHIIPRVLGGDNSAENLTVACFQCNRSKGGKTLEQWLGGDDG